MPEARVWTRTERRPILPFSSFEDFSHAIALKLRPNEEFDSTGQRDIDREEVESLEPALRLGTAGPSLLDATNCPATALIVTVGISIPTLKSFDVIRNWSPPSIPEEEALPELRQRLENGAVELHVTATNTEPFSDRNGNEVPIYSTLGKAIFSISPPPEDRGFPIVWLSPEDLQREGYPADTPWIVTFKDSDYTLAPAEVVEVGLNKRLDGKLQQLVDQTTAGRIFAAAMANEILGEVVLKVLLDTDPGTQPEGLLEVCRKRVDEDADLDEVINLAKDDPLKILAVVRGQSELLDQLLGYRPRAGGQQ